MGFLSNLAPYWLDSVTTSECWRGVEKPGAENKKSKHRISPVSLSMLQRLLLTDNKQLKVIRRLEPQNFN